jgi:hypothetical protein
VDDLKELVEKLRYLLLNQLPNLEEFGLNQYSLEEDASFSPFYFI